MNARTDRAAERVADRVAKRDESVARQLMSGNRYGDVTVSPFWLVEVAWPGERCPTCTRQLDVETAAVWDDEEQAVFCVACARKHLDRLDG